MLLWLWCRLVAVASIWPLAWKLPYAASVAPQKPKKLKKKIVFISCDYALLISQASSSLCSRSFTPTSQYVYLFIFFVFFFFFNLFRTAPLAYGGSQAKGLTGPVAAGLCHCHSKCQIWATSMTYTTAHGNTRSLTRWAKPGIEPTTSWFPVRFISAAPWRELQKFFNL